MKKWFLLFLLPALVLGSCKKESSGCNDVPAGVASSSETAYLQNYLSTNGIGATSIHGMFYTVTTPGSGIAPNQCSTITVTYTATQIIGTTDNTPFDASLTPVAFQLSQLIAGWQLVMPLMREGAQVTLYIPPSLAYGTAAVGTAPGYSYFKFVITLVSVQ